MATSATYNFPGLTIEWAQTSGVGTAASSWTDITAYVREFSISRGRQRELDRFEAGTATLTLSNRDRRFDPLYSSGPYFGNLLPMRQIRIRATWASTTYDLFRGYVEGWPQVYPETGKDSVVQVTCVDGFGVLANAELSDSVYATEIESDSPVVWFRLGESTGTVMGDSSGNGRHGVFQTAVKGQGTGLVPYTDNGALQFDGVNDYGYAQTEAGVIAGASCTVEWTMKLTSVPAAATGIAAYTDSSHPSSPGLTVRLGANGGGLTFESGDGNFVDTLTSFTFAAGATYHCIWSDTTGLYVNGVANTAGFSVGAGGSLPHARGFWVGTDKATFLPATLDEVVWYSSDLGATAFTDHYTAFATAWSGDLSGARMERILDAAGWPASLRDIDTGTSVCGPTKLGGNALDYLQRLAQTEAGYFYITDDGNVRLVGRANILSESTYSTSQATFGDSTGELKYSDLQTSYDNQLIYNRARVSREGGDTQQYDDTTSQAAYGIRSIDESGLLMSSDGSAYDRAIWRVLRYKDPAFRVDALAVQGTRDAANLWPKVLDLELGTRITVKRRPLGVGSAISQECHIEGIAHDVDPGSKTWTTTYYLSPVDPTTTWALAGVATAGNYRVAY